MKTLIIGAGPLGSLYTYLFHKAGKDVTLLASKEELEGFDFMDKSSIEPILKWVQHIQADHVLSH